MGGGLPNIGKLAIISASSNSWECPSKDKELWARKEHSHKHCLSFCRWVMYHMKKRRNPGEGRKEEQRNGGKNRKNKAGLLYPSPNLVLRPKYSFVIKSASLVKLNSYPLRVGQLGQVLV